jgi:tRNA threonylcarbamoyl adenosine modification protein YjeE
LKSEHGFSEETLATWAGQFARDLKPGAVVQLEGPLGAGKSTLARFLIHALGGPAHSEGSPTFAIVHEYETSAGISLRHADLYRLKSESEIEDAGVSASVWEAGDDAIHLIEWVSLFPDFERDLRRLPRLGRDFWKITLTPDATEPLLRSVTWESPQLKT